jgi:D-alanyl-lipoteichoic acid acyltransferase DltB (MBOAT superfamily)
MLFSSGDYPLFLLAVFGLYALARAGRGVGLWARGAAMVVFADIIYLLLTKDLTTLWDPLGGGLLHLVVDTDPNAPAPWPAWWHFAVGAGVLGAAVAAGARFADVIAGPRGQRWIGIVLTCGLVATGITLRGLGDSDQIDEFTRTLAGYSHLLYLVVVGVAVGAALARPNNILGRALVLFLVSALFYHAWAAAMHGAYRYLLCLLLGTITLDYYLGLAIERTEDPVRRKVLLIVSLVSNLGILFFFKYNDFFAIDVLHVRDQPWNLILPAGISFHTFQSLSYTIDVYRRELPATKSIIQFATFVLFFPQLVAGPIVRADELLPQLAAPPAHDTRKAADGLWRIVLGLFKKIALADVLARMIVDNVFKHPDRYSSLEVLVGVVAYAFQIYLDFSAYSDIAIGSAQLLGFDLPENFRTPYRSANLQEFWRRWHMSLSRWLRDYLYIPLGGSRGGELATYRNLILTMLLGGLWHGANWTFIVWGALHGGGLAMTRVFQRRVAARPQDAVRTLGRFAAITAAGVVVHLTAFRSVENPWLHLGFAWAYATPFWAAATAWLSRDERGPALTGRHRHGAPIAALVGCGFMVLLVAALHDGKPDLALAMIGAGLAAAIAAAVLDVGPDQASAVRWLAWAGQRAAAVVLVFLYVCVAWVFFRATSFDHALTVFDRIAAIGDPGELEHANILPLLVVAMTAALASHWVPDRTLAWLRDQFIAMHPAYQGFAIAVAANTLVAMSHPTIVPFIYFQF